MAEPNFLSRIRRPQADPSSRLRSVRGLPAESASCASLLAAVDDPSLEVAKAALRRLAFLGSSVEAEHLRARLLSADLGLVAEYARTLRELGDRESVDIACAGLRHASPTTRIGAATALAELEDPRAAPSLRAALADPIAGVRRTALQALARLGRDELSERASARLLTDPDTDVRIAAVRALPYVATDPESALQPALHDPAARVRRELARLAGRMITQVQRQLAADDDSDVRATMMWALVKQPRPDARPFVIAALDDPVWHVRRAACRALGSAGDERARAALVHELIDPHPTVRAAASRALHEIFGDRFTEIVAAELWAADPALRRALIYRLAESADAGAASSIARLEHDADARVRIAVVHALAQLRPADADPILERLGHDPDAGVRHAAARALSDEGAQR